MLDEAGEGALDVPVASRAAHGGVGSIYWYVAGKDELIQRAADEVIGRLLAQTAATVTGGDPSPRSARLPWRSTPRCTSTLDRRAPDARCGASAHLLVLYERFGQQVPGCR